MSTQLALQDSSLGPLKDLLGKLSGDDGGFWLRALKRFLRKENPWDGLISIADLPVFKVVRRGGHTSPANSKALLESAGFKLSRWGADILAHADYSDTREEMEVVLVSNVDLDLPLGGPRSETYRLASVQGLDLLPHWGASALGEDCADLPINNGLFIATEPIVDSLGNPRFFGLGHDRDGLWLHGIDGNPSTHWPSLTRWTFVRRCKPASPENLRQVAP